MNEEERIADRLEYSEPSAEYNRTLSPAVRDFYSLVDPQESSSTKPNGMRADVDTFTDKLSKADSSGSTAQSNPVVGAVSAIAAGAVIASGSGNTEPPVVPEPTQQVVPAEIDKTWESNKPDVTKMSKKQRIETIQALIGTTPDGKWGKNSRAAMKKVQYGNNTELKEQIQHMVGTKVDGDWKSKSNAALNKLTLKEETASDMVATAKQVSKDVKVQNEFLLDLNNFSNKIEAPTKGQNPLRWMAENVYGLDENDADHRKALKKFIGSDPKTIPWCASLAYEVLKGVGADLPARAKLNKASAYNFQELGEPVYDYMPESKKRASKVYSGSIKDVQEGDVIVFNSSKKGRNNSKGDFNFDNGHVSFVISVEPDGSIIALGGNQGGGKSVTTTRYTPAIVKKYFPAGFKVRRVTGTTIKKTDPKVIAELTANIAKGANER